MVMETDLELVRSVASFAGPDGCAYLQADTLQRLLRLAETAALIVEHKGILRVMQNLDGGWEKDLATTGLDLHTAVCAVAAKIQEVNNV